MGVSQGSCGGCAREMPEAHWGRFFLHEKIATPSNTTTFRNLFCRQRNFSRARQKSLLIAPSPPSPFRNIPHSLISPPSLPTASCLHFPLRPDDPMPTTDHGPKLNFNAPYVRIRRGRGLFHQDPRLRRFAHPAQAQSASGRCACRDQS